MPSESASASEPEFHPEGVFTKDEDTALYAVWAQPDFVLPYSLDTIEDKAFAGCAFNFVELPEQAVMVGCDAFADCSNLTYIYIPELTTEIHAQAFGDLRELTILGKDGTTAESYAQSHNYSFIAVP